MIPLTCDIERMKQGGEHWQWDSNIPVYFGVVPRRGAKGSDVKVRSIRHVIIKLIFAVVPVTKCFSWPCVQCVRGKRKDSP